MSESENSKKRIAIECEGKIVIHASGSEIPGDYATLCGMDGADDHKYVQQRTVPTPPRRRINCHHCLMIVLAARKYNRSDFAKETLTI